MPQTALALLLFDIEEVDLIRKAIFRHQHISLNVK